MGPIKIVPELIDFMLLHILRDPSLFQLAKTHLKPEHFHHSSETEYRHLWAVALSINEADRQMPTREACAAFTGESLQHEELTSAQLGYHAQLLVDHVFDREKNPDGELRPDLAVEVLKAFLSDRTIMTKAETISTERTAGGAVDVAAFTQYIADRHREIAMLSRRGRLLACPPEWSYPQLDLTPTGVKPIDRYLDNGVAPAEVHVLLGPTGVAKTLVGMQLCVTAAERQSLIAEDGGSPKLAVFVSYEDGAWSMQTRALCFAAKVDKAALEAMSGYSDLSTRHNLKEYELASQSAFMVPERRGEQERIDEARPWLNNYLGLVDFSNTPESIGGSGGIEEAKYAIMGLCDEMQMPLAMAVIDWAGACVGKQIRATQADPSSLTARLGAFVQDVHDLIAAPMQAPIWVMHQLRGQANKYKAGAPISHADAQWCSTFADNAHSALVIGTKSDEAIVSFNCSKNRRGETKRPVLCRINGRFGELLAADDVSLDPHTGRIISQAEAQALGAYDDDEIDDMIADDGMDGIVA
jgi:hypothetical protein